MLDGTVDTGCSRCCSRGYVGGKFGFSSSHWRILIFCLGLSLGALPSASQAQCYSSGSNFTARCEASSPDTIPTYGAGMQSFIFKNIMSNGADVQFTVECSSGLSCNQSQYGYSMGAGDSIRFMVDYTTASATGSEWIKVSWDTWGWYGTGWFMKVFNVNSKTIAEPGSSLYPYQSISASPVNNFANVYTHSTVPFFTQDQPRSFTLVHNSDYAAPYALLGMDFIQPAGSLLATSYSLSAGRTGGSAFQFTNGETDLNFTGNMAGRTVTYDYWCLEFNPLWMTTMNTLEDCQTVTNPDSMAKFYGRVDLRSEPTGIVPVSVGLNVLYNGSPYYINYSSSTYLLHVNTSMDSAFYGKGWAVAGLQRLYWTGSPAKYMIVEPGGATVYYSGLGNAAIDNSSLSYASSVYTRNYMDGTKALFDAYGYLTEINHPRGDTTRFTYDGAGRLTSIKDPVRVRTGSGIYLTMSYDGNGRLSSVQEVGGTGGRTTSYHVNASTARLDAIVDPDGDSTAFTYDSDNRLRTLRDRRGAVTGFAYSTTTGKLMADTLPTVPIDAGGGSTSNGRPVIKYTHWSLTGVPSSSTSTTAAPVLLRDTAFSKIIDPKGATTKYALDATNQPVVIVDPRGEITRIARVGLMPRTIMYPDSAVDSLEYNSSNQLIKSKPVGGTWTNYAYGAFGQMTSASGDPYPSYPIEARYVNPTHGGVDSIMTVKLDGSGNEVYMITRFAYDSWGQLIGRRTSAGHRDSVYYDAATRNSNGTWTEGGVISSRTFDDYGRVKTTRAAQGERVDWSSHSLMDTGLSC